MIIQCPHCAKGNRIPNEKLLQGPICGACKQDLLSLPINANTGQFTDIITQTSLAVIVDFWAPWCGPCKSFAPTFQASAIKHAQQIIYVKVNTEAEPALGSQFNIRSIPTLAAFKYGKELQRISGALPPAQLEQFVNQLIAA